jgi:tyrosyl-tRNA synthetase
MDLIRRLRSGKVHGLVMPLITSSSGVKFGKTESGAVWLDPDLTSPYQFYQFWLNTDDRDAIRYLRFFTFLAREEIGALEDAGRREPDKRHPQRALAREVTRLVHGEAAVAEAEAAAHALFADQLSSLTAGQVEQALAGVPSASVAFNAAGWPVTELLTIGGVTKSKSEAQRLISGGGVSINDRRVTDQKTQVNIEQAIERRLFVVRKGKRDYFLIWITRA